MTSGAAGGGGAPATSASTASSGSATPGAGRGGSLEVWARTGTDIKHANAVMPMRFFICRSIGGRRRQQQPTQRAVVGLGAGHPHFPVPHVPPVGHEVVVVAEEEGGRHARGCGGRYIVGRQRV